MKELAVIFDMDGVIAHTNPYHAKAFEAFFDKYQIPYSDEEFEKHMYGKHNSYIFTHFFKRPIAGQELLSLEKEKEGLFREIYKLEAKPIPYLPDFLSNLKDNEIKLGVATSAPLANMDLILDTLDIRNFFQSTLGSENVELHKPHPEVYLKSANNLNMDPQNCFVFEDSFSGVTAGLNANMNVIGVLSSHKKEDLPVCLDYIDNYKNMNVDKLKSLYKQHVG
ncbi:HAD family hydrolase [Sphingobacterium sp. BS-2]|uniref:HAD family hydrolase n=1 Tax=Sphingobacterium sp. BS-2 TaxID=3377129 RepID=UPI0038FCFC1C